MFLWRFVEKKEKYNVVDTSSYLELSNVRSHLGEKCCFRKETRRNNAKSKQQKSGPFCVSLTFCFTNKTCELYIYIFHANCLQKTIFDISCKLSPFGDNLHEMFNPVFLEEMKKHIYFNMFYSN